MWAKFVKTQIAN